MRRLAASFALVLLSVVARANVASTSPQPSPEPPAPPQHQGAPANDQQSGRQGPITQPSNYDQSTPRNQQDAAKPQWYKEPQWVIALFTIGIFVATLVYAIFAALQWRAIRHQAQTLEATLKLATHNMVLSNPPRLSARNVALEPASGQQISEPRDWFVLGQPMHAHFTVVNTGGTLAEIIDSGAWIVWHKGESLPMEPIYNQPATPDTPFIHGTWHAGQHNIFTVQSDQALDRSADDFLMKPDWYLCVLGFVDYKDLLGVHRRMAFCRRWHRHRDRFEKVDNPDYEYE